jgi:hypothetical protein
MRARAVGTAQNPNRNFTRLSGNFLFSRDGNRFPFLRILRANTK